MCTGSRAETDDAQFDEPHELRFGREDGFEPAEQESVELGGALLVEPVAGALPGDHAVMGALQQVALGLLDDHVRHCVLDAVRHDSAEGEQKLAELNEAMRRALRV